MKSKTALICALVVIGVLAFNGTTQAKRLPDIAVNGTVTLTHTVNPAGLDTFSGKLSAGNTRCLKTQIEIWSGTNVFDSQNIPSTQVRTAPDGTFTISYEPASGTSYYVLAGGSLYHAGVKKVKSKGKTRVREITCHVKQSNVIRVP